MKLQLIQSKSCPCSLEQFIINDIIADYEDFGEIDKESNGHECQIFGFKAKDPSDEILKKYEITLDEYDQVCNKLDVIFMGYCQLCI